MPGGRCRAIARHEPAPREPIRVRANEPLTIGREDDEWPGWVWCTTATSVSGWLPLAYLRATGEGIVAICDYNATELPAEVGDHLQIEQVVNGWLWCANVSGQRGWVPTLSVKPVAG